MSNNENQKLTLKAYTGFAGEYNIHKINGRKFDWWHTI